MFLEKDSIHDLFYWNTCTPTKVTVSNQITHRKINYPNFTSSEISNSANID